MAYLSHGGAWCSVSNSKVSKMSKSKNAPVAPAANVQVPHIQLIAGAVPKFRTGTARDLLFQAVAAYDGKPLADYVAFVTANPPSVPQRGKTAGKLESPEGWVKYFARQGLAVTVAK